MKREFVVVDEEDGYGQTILSLAAQEVGRVPHVLASLG